MSKSVRLQAAVAISMHLYIHHKERMSRERDMSVCFELARLGSVSNAEGCTGQGAQLEVLLLGQAELSPWRC